MQRSYRVALVAAVVLVAWFGAIVVDHGGNPSSLLAAGIDDTRVTGYIADQLGPTFQPQQAWGHDGKFVFVQARDPFLLEPDHAATVLDSPVYRSQRVLVPALVGLGGVAGPWGVVWAFPVLMVTAASIGAGATARLAELAGRSPWWGMLFLANPGLFYSYRRGTVDVVAVTLLVVAVLLVTGRRHRLAGGALALSALAKEVMLLAAFGMAWHRRHDRPAAAWLALTPLMAVAGWAVYVRVRLTEPLLAVGTRALAAPFEGLIATLGRWPDPGAVVAALVAGVAVGAIGLALARPSVALAAAAGPAFLLLWLPETVWGGYVDAWRAAAPIVAMLVVAGLQSGGDFLSRSATTIAPSDLSRHRVAGEHRHSRSARAQPQEPVA